MLVDMGYPAHNLAPGEAVVLHRHPHWKLLVGPFVIFAIVTLLAGVLARDHQRFVAARRRSDGSVYRGGRVLGPRVGVGRPASAVQLGDDPLRGHRPTRHLPQRHPHPGRY